jgi:hypothetical protein
MSEAELLCCEGGCYDLLVKSTIAGKVRNLK